jgi:hypothetical protein
LEVIDAPSSRVADEERVDNVWLGTAAVLDVVGDREKMPARSLVANHSMIRIIYARPGKGSIRR